jgi:hypothetical protein
MAIVRGLIVMFEGGPDCCCAVECAMEEGGDVLEARAIQGCDHPPVTTWFGAGLCEDHRRRLQVKGGWSNN